MRLDAEHILSLAHDASLDLKAEKSNHESDVPTALIRLAVLMGKDPFAVRRERRFQVVFRIAAIVALRSIADFEQDDCSIGSIDELMRDAIRRKSGAHAGAKLDLFVFCNERRFAIEDIDELILLAVPMQQSRLAIGRERREVDAEIFQAEKSPNGRFSRPAMRLRNGSG